MGDISYGDVRSTIFMKIYEGVNHHDLCPILLLHLAHSADESNKKALQLQGFRLCVQ